MPFSNSLTHPTGQANPCVLRAWAALPANNAWDATPAVAVVQGFWWARLYFAYRRTDDVLGGTLDYYYDLSPYYADASIDVGLSGQVWYHGTLYVPGKLTPCQIAHSTVQQEFISYCSTSGDVETFIGPPVHLGGCIERIRVFCREGTLKASPGLAEVVALFYNEG